MFVFVNSIMSRAGRCCACSEGWRSVHRVLGLASRPS